MAKPKTGPGGLQVGEDRAWQERFWTVQRVVWGVMTLFVIGALLGVTGSGGPMAYASARTPLALIEYPRITRWQADDEITVRLPASLSGNVDIELSDSFTERFFVERVHPEPSAVAAAGTGHRYSFDLGQEAGDKSITFVVRADHPFFERKIAAKVGDAPPAQMTLTVLP